MSSWRSRIAARDGCPAGFIPPCLLTASATVPRGPDWTYEVKHDGFRLCARADDGRPRIWTRPGNNRTAEFAAIAAGLAEIGSVVIDGEAVCQLPDGQSDFHALRSRGGCARATLWAFDLLMIDGEDIRALPIEARRDRLRRLIGDAKPAGIAFSDHHDRDGEDLFAAACRMGLEGIVAKRKGTRYSSGRCRHWVKIKNPAFVRPLA
jgi:bifunctional non-homologous end joining protein LigD